MEQAELPIPPLTLAESCLLLVMQLLPQRSLVLRYTSLAVLHHAAAVFCHLPVLCFCAATSSCYQHLLNVATEQRVRAGELHAAICIPFTDEWCASWQAHHLFGDGQRLELKEL
jgi:hypothetical protein